jgi:D-ribose pyranase
MASEFKEVNHLETQNAFFEAATGIPLVFEPHVNLKKRVPGAIGLVRTGDTVQYANMILESGLVENVLK